MNTGFRSASNKARSKAPTTRQRAGREKEGNPGWRSWMSAREFLSFLIQGHHEGRPLGSHGQKRLAFSQQWRDKHRSTGALGEHYTAFLKTQPCWIQKRLKGIMRSYVFINTTKAKKAGLWEKKVKQTHCAYTMHESRCLIC